MPVTSTNYWSTVFEELQSEMKRNTRIKYFYVEKRYDLCVRRIEDRLRAWYGRHSLDGKVPLRQVYKKLPPDQLEQFKDLIDFYLRNWSEELGYDLDEKPIEHAHEVSGKDTNGDDEGYESKREASELSETNEWIEFLQSCKDRDDLTYYDTLSIPVLNEIEEASYDTANTLLALLLMTGWTVHSDIVKNLKLQGLSQNKLKEELLKSWASDNMTLHDRLSRNEALLSSAVNSTLVKGFRNEMSVEDVIDEVSKVMGVGKVAAKRLVTTENTHFNCYSTLLAIKEAGYNAYEIVATIDAKTCDDCIAWDGDIYPIEVYEANLTAPPKHSHCRCFIRPANLGEIK